MSRLLKHFIAVIVVVATTLGATAQRRVTPVEPTKPVTPLTETQRKEQERQRLVESKDEQGRIVLIDTVTGTEYVDSTKIHIAKMLYPRLYKVTAGLNIADAAMRCLGQQYGLLGAWGELNMHNRYFPRLEVGLGQASIKPDGMNYTFRVPVAPYFKIGAAYNVFYNSDPRYLFLVGLNYGFTPFRYRVDNVDINDSYWGETVTMNIPAQNAVVGFYEVTFGVRVNIVSRFSVAWHGIFHGILHENKAAYGKPMYIPGYGKRSGSLGFSLSATWDFDLNKVTDKSVFK